PTPSHATGARRRDQGPRAAPPRSAPRSLPRVHGGGLASRAGLEPRARAPERDQIVVAEPPDGARRVGRSLAGNSLLLASVGEAPGGSETEDHPPAPAHARSPKEHGPPLRTDTVQIIEAQADIARCQRARPGVIDDPPLSRLEPRPQELAASVDLHSI